MPDPFPVFVDGAKPSLVRCSLCKLPVVNDSKSKYSHKARCFVNGQQVFYPNLTRSTALTGPRLTFEPFREGIGADIRA